MTVLELQGNLNREIPIAIRDHSESLSGHTMYLRPDERQLVDIQADLMYQLFDSQTKKPERRLRKDGVTPSGVHLIAVADILTGAQWQESSPSLYTPSPVIRSPLDRIGTKLATILTGIHHDDDEDLRIPSVYATTSLPPDVRREVIENVKALTIVDSGSSQLREAEAKAEIFKSFIDNPDVPLVKTADTLHNLRTIHGLTAQKQKKFAEVSLQLLYPMAKLMNVPWREELFVRCVEVLYPEYFQEAKEYQKQMQRQMKAAHSYLENKKDSLLTKHIVAFPDRFRFAVGLPAVSDMMKFTDEGIIVEKPHYVPASVVCHTEDFQALFESFQQYYDEDRVAQLQRDGIIFFDHENGIARVPRHIDDTNLMITMYTEQAYRKISASAIDISRAVPQPWMFESEDEYHQSIVELQERKRYLDEKLRLPRQYIQLLRQGAIDPYMFISQVSERIRQPLLHIRTPVEDRQIPVGANARFLAYDIHKELGRIADGVLIGDDRETVYPLTTVLQNGEYYEIHKHPDGKWAVNATALRELPPGSKAIRSAIKEDLRFVLRLESKYKKNGVTALEKDLAMMHWTVEDLEAKLHLIHRDLENMGEKTIMATFAEEYGRYPWIDLKEGWDLLPSRFRKTIKEYQRFIELCGMEGVHPDNLKDFIKGIHSIEHLQVKTVMYDIPDTRGSLGTMGIQAGLALNIVDVLVDRNLPDLPAGMARISLKVKPESEDFATYDQLLQQIAAEMRQGVQTTVQKDVTFVLPLRDTSSVTSITSFVESQGFIVWGVERSDGRCTLLVKPRCAEDASIEEADIHTMKQTLGILQDIRRGVHSDSVGLVYSRV